MTGSLAAWALVAAVLRVVVVMPERCPPVTAGDLRAAADEAVAWFARNARADGSWMYRYDAEADADLGGYNIVRHAGVTMALEQAATAGLDGAAELAAAGTDWARERLVPAGGGLALAEPGEDVQVGATALLVAALAERRDRTGDDRLDEELVALGRFLVGQVEPSGAVLARWDPATGAPVPGVRSPFFTGETGWALARLHATLPDEGFGEPARRVSRYLATARDDAEGHWPDIPDHWAAYALETISGWPGDEGVLTDEEAAYARAQAALAGMQVRWESQRTDEVPNWWLRGRRTLGAGLGTIGELLDGLWLVARTDPRLADLREPLATRAACVAGMLVERQVDADEARGMAGPDRARGAWFQFGVTQMDDQQHALSALLRAIPLVEEAA